MDFMTGNNLLIDNDFKLLFDLNLDNNLFETMKPDKNKLVEIANYLWISEMTNQPLNDGDMEKYIHYLISQWKLPHSGILNSLPNIYTSNIALVYAAIELVKNNHNKHELQQYLTQIKDFVFDNLLMEGKLISSVNNKNVTPDELLTVWPFNLFSAEDLVLVQAADDIFQNYDSIGLYWQQMYIHYLLSRSFYENAETLYEKLPQNRPTNGIGGALNARIKTYNQKSHLSNVGVIFQHTITGNYNRYSPLETQRTPFQPVEGDTLYFPVRVVSDKQVEHVRLVIRQHENIKKFELTRQGDIWSITTALNICGEFQYYFEAAGKDFTEHSNDYNLTLLKKVAVTKLSICEFDRDHMSLQLLDNSEFDYGSVNITVANDGFHISIENDKQMKKMHIVQNQIYQLREHGININFDAEKESLLITKNEKIIFNHTTADPKIVLLVTENRFIEKISLKINANCTEKFWGFGERYNSLNQSGNIVDNYVFNQYRNQGIRTYMPMPLYISSEGYGLLLSTKMYSEFDLTGAPSGKDIRINIEVSSASHDYIYLTSGSVHEILPKISAMTGKPAMLPTWAMGLWMSSNNWDRQSVVDNQLELAIRTKIPATVFVLEQWSDEATYYMFNDSEYDNYKSVDEIKEHKISFPSWGRWPNPRKMISNIHEQGMKLILWQIPVLKEYPLGRNAMLDSDKQYAINNKYVLNNEDGTPYYIPEGWFTNALVWDPTNSNATKWWFGKRQYLLDMGVDGFKTDGGECIFGDKVLASNGMRGNEMRNQYPLSYIGTYYNFLKQKKGITFSRSGYTGAQVMPAHWAGDERSTFDAFQRSLKAGLNAGISGLIFWGWDFSGFNGEIPTSELYLRATEMATFTPIMQYHAESKAQFNQDRTPWNIQERTGDRKVIPVFKKYADLRMNLLPYIYDESRKAVEERLPLMRALLIDYQDDQLVNDCYDEYLFGDALLVAPIITEGETKRNVYFPEGEWCDLFSNEIIEGSRMIQNVEAEIDEIPVYIKENTAVLLNTHSDKLMSYVGNSVERYDQPVIKIFANSEFQQSIFDHLGNNIRVKVTRTNDNGFNIQVDSEIKNLHVDVLGNTKVKVTVQYIGRN